MDNRSFEKVGDTAAVATFERLVLIASDEEFEGPLVLCAVRNRLSPLICDTERVPLMDCLFLVLPSDSSLRWCCMISKWLLAQSHHDERANNVPKPHPTGKLELYPLSMLLLRHKKDDFTAEIFSLRFRPVTTKKDIIAIRSWIILVAETDADVEGQTYIIVIRSFLGPVTLTNSDFIVEATAMVQIKSVSNMESAAKADFDTRGNNAIIMEIGTIEIEKSLN